jgi:hypothetical protein
MPNGERCRHPGPRPPRWRSSPAAARAASPVLPPLSRAARSDFDRERRNESEMDREHENASCGSDKDCGLHTTRADVLPCLPGPAGMESTGSRGAARCFPLPVTLLCSYRLRACMLACSCPQAGATPPQTRAAACARRSYAVRDGLARGERYARGRGAGGQPQRPAPLACSASDRSEGEYHAPFAFLSINTCHMFEPSRAHAFILQTKNIQQVL